MSWIKSLDNSVLHPHEKKEADKVDDFVKFFWEGKKSVCRHRLDLSGSGSVPAAARLGFHSLPIFNLCSFALH